MYILSSQALTKLEKIMDFNKKKKKAILEKQKCKSKLKFHTLKKF